MHLKFKGGGFHSDSTPRLTISRIEVMFEADGSINDLQKNRSRRLRISVNPMKQEGEMGIFTVI